jgi:Cof subfamily protein (haloacid dehalogenase superfamily)
MFRLLAVDLDGTLLRRDGRVDDRDVAAIRGLAAAGVTVTIATGRLRTGSVAAARACGIAGTIACCEGSHLVDVAGTRTLFHHPIGDDAAAAMRAAFGAAGLAAFVFDAEGIHHDRAGAPYAGYVSTWSTNLRVVDTALHDDAWRGPALAAVAVGEADAIAAVATTLHARADVFAVSFAVSAVSGKHAILARAAGASKGTALAALCAEAGCGVEEAVVVGDWFNDVPMFEVAGRAFAMGTAPDVVRDAATDLLEAPAGMGGGIAEAIARVWGVTAAADR